MWRRTWYDQTGTLLSFFSAVSINIGTVTCFCVFIRCFLRVWSTVLNICVLCRVPKNVVNVRSKNQCAVTPTRVVVMIIVTSLPCALLTPRYDVLVVVNVLYSLDSV